MARDLITGGECLALQKRALTKETCEKFGYRVADFGAQKVQVAPFFDEDGNIVAQKVRFANKDFTVTGDLKKAVLFGQHLWPSGGRKVVITEGEIDAMSVSQAQAHKWPVVSIKNGASGAKKCLSEQLQWLNTFEEVVLMFDMDEPGKKAAQECATLFPPGKCKIAHLSMKDPNELLAAGKTDEIVKAIWNAASYRPDGVVTLDDLWDSMMEPREQGLPWAFDKLTKLTYGRAWGKIYAFGAGTGVGKTDWLTQQMAYDIAVLNQPVGVFSFEQQPKETLKRIAGKIVGKRFHVPAENAGWTLDDLKAARDVVKGSGKLYFYDNFGATDWDIVRETIRFLNKNEGVRIFYLDHLTALAAAEDDERTALEKIMAEMGGLVKELDIIIHLVSHLATPEGTPHEEGGRVMIRHFKGSRAIGFWCAYMFGLERDQQHENPDVATCTTFRILKDRDSGDSTGQCIYLGYDREYGRLYEREAPDPEAPQFVDETQPESAAKSSDDDLPF